MSAEQTGAVSLPLSDQRINRSIFTVAKDAARNAVTPVVLVTLPLASLLSACGNDSSTEVTPNPIESSSNPYDLQMPPALPDGATCDEVLQRMSDQAGEKPYIQIGRGVLLDVKSFKGIPGENINGVIILGGVTSQEQADSVRNEVEPTLIDWYAKTEVAGKLRIEWMVGELTNEDGVYLIDQTIQMERTGPADGCHPVGPIS